MPQLNMDNTQNAEESTFYDRFAAIIFQYLLQQVSNVQDAEDLLLEVFVAALQDKSLINLPAGRQLAWLKRVARYKVIDRYRHVALLNLLPIEHALELEDTALMPGIYTGNIFFVTGHSTLTVTVALTVQATLPFVSPIMSVSPLSLNFSNIQGQPNPPDQVITISNNGLRALNWNTNIQVSAPNWLTSSPAYGEVLPGQSWQVNVHVNTTQLIPGNYVGQITLNGIDASGKLALGSPQIITVNLVVLSESGTCARPVTWQASTNSSWLALAATSGMDSGTGITFGVTASALNEVPGTYTGIITITALDSAGLAVGSPQSVAVTLTVTGFTINGTVQACADQTCASPQALAGATVTLVSGNTIVTTTTADASGNYSFTNIPLGRYTITATGYDANNTHYTGGTSISLTGNASNISIQALPGP